MAEAPSTPVFIDGFSSFQRGINSDIAPILVPRDQLSFAINTTMRGSFATHRPPYLKIALTYDGDIQTVFELGFFQGAVFFTPDSGSPSLLAMISGRLFRVVPDDIGGALVSEVVIVGGPNPASGLQSWLWQSERWAIINDGISLPIIYDGVTARRSLGNTSIVVATTAAGFTVPAIGADVEIEVTAPYAFGIGIPVTINGESYTVKSFRSTGTSAYTLTMQQTAGAAAVAYPNGTELREPSNYFAFVSVGTATPFPFLTPTTTQRTITLTKPYTGSVGDSVIISTLYSPAGVTNPTLYTVRSISGLNINVSLTNQYASTLSIVAGAPISKSPQSWSTMANAYAFVSPGTGGSVTVNTVAAFSGAIGDFVYPPSATEEYQVTAQGVSGGSQFFVTFTNVNAVPAAVIGFPQSVTNLSYELPVGRMGVYGMGRNWISLPDGRSFIGSDLVGSSSGTATFNYRDAVLNITENNFLAGGGVFIIPGTIGSITAMVFTATLDTSMGQGALQVGTSSTMFSCNAPVDRALWQNLENPILTESLIGEGPLGQNSTLAANSDTLFRTNIGLGSLILARRDFATWGNVSISSEVNRIVDRDNISLLNYGSAIVFRNRLLMTSLPTQTQGGFIHPGLISLNFDPLSSLAGKLPSIYEGLWLGFNSLQLVKGRINAENRAFSFCFNQSTNKIELYEILKDGVRTTDYNGAANIPITWQLETGVLFNKTKGKGEFDLVKIIDGELFVAEVKDRVRFRVDYRSQFDPCWHLWSEFSICATPSATTTDNNQNQNRVSLGLGKPPVDACDPSNNRPYYVGEMFQFRITITGHCKFYGMAIKASQEPKSYFVKAVCGDQECRLVSCSVGDDYDVYQMEDLFTEEDVPEIFNQRVFFIHTCGVGAILAYPGQLPTGITLESEANRLVMAAGIYQAATQAQANAIAQNALDVFATAALADGSLECLQPVCPDWAALAWEPAFVFELVNGDATYFNSPAQFNVGASAPDSSLGDSAFVSQAATVEYNGAGCQANLHVEIEKIGESEFGIVLLCGGITITTSTGLTLLDVPIATTPNGTYEFAFTVPATPSGPITITVQISARAPCTTGISIPISVGLLGAISSV